MFLVKLVFFLFLLVVKMFKLNFFTSSKDDIGRNFATISEINEI